MVRVDRHPGETDAELFRRFTRAVAKSGILADEKRKRFFRSRREIRRAKRAIRARRARRRQLRWMDDPRGQPSAAFTPIRGGKRDHDANG